MGELNVAATTYLGNGTGNANPDQATRTKLISGDTMLIHSWISMARVTLTGQE